MYLSVKEVKQLDEYKSVFNSVKVSFDTIEWKVKSNGWNSYWISMF